MKTLKLMALASLLVAPFICSTSCSDDYDDSQLQEDVNGLIDRVTKLEQLCKEMNTNISSLEMIVKALEQKDFITAITPINEEGKEIGYTITFDKNKSITIYNGNDGKDGVTPEISIKKADDGLFYWTVNSEWLLDSDKQKVKATGDTPLLKIEEGYWYISYNRGATWEKTGSAQGEKGDQGDSVFKNVTYDAEKVIFTLMDGTQLEIPLKKRTGVFSVSFLPEFMDCMAVVDNENYKKGLVTMNFKVSPKEVATAIVSNWKSTVSMQAYYTSYTRSIDMVDMPVTSVSADNGSGIITVKASGENLSHDFYQRLKGANALLSIKYNDCTISSEPIRIESNKALDNMILYENGEDFYSMFKDNVNRGYWNGNDLLDQHYHNNMGNLTFKKSLTEIPDEGFNSDMVRCHVKKVILPDNISRIGDYAFWKCDVEEIVLPKNLKEIGLNAFSDCSVLSKMVLPEGLETISEGAFGGTALSEITIPQSVTSIHANIFWNCDHIKNFYGKFTSADHKCFILNETLIKYASKSSVTTYTIPSGIKSIWQLAFWGCDKLIKLVIPSGVISIDNYAFTSSSLKEVKLSDGLTEIGNYAFESSQLESISIPSSVTRLGNGVFSNCRKLQSITFEGITPPFPMNENDNIMDGNVQATIYVPDASVELYKKAFSVVADQVKPVSSKLSK